MLIACQTYADFKLVANKITVPDGVFFSTGAFVNNHAGGMKVCGVNGTRAVQANIGSDGTLPSAATIIADYPGAIQVGADLAISG